MIVLVLVVMIVMSGVAVSVMGIVHMVTVGDRLMPAASLVTMSVTSMGQVRQRMLVVMTLVRGMGMAIVNIVDVPPALGAGVPAAGPVLVLVRAMNHMLVSHDSSLL